MRLRRIVRKYDNNNFRSDGHVYLKENKLIKPSIRSPIHIVAESGLCDVEIKFRVM